MNAEDRYDSLFKFYAEKHFMDWRRLKAQVKVESDFNPDAANPRTGAAGLAQFMPPTWEEWEDGTPGVQEIRDRLKLLDPRDPEDAIAGQAAYIDWLIKIVGDGEKALAAYNWGVGNLGKTIAEFGADWKLHIPLETQNYLTRIEAFYSQYQKELA